MRRIFVLSILVSQFLMPLGAYGQAAVGDDVTYPYLPTVISAKQTFASHLDTESVSDEPLTMTFTAIASNSASEAKTTFSKIVEWQKIDVSNNAGDPYDEVSVGELGNERTSFYRHDSDYPRSIYVIVRLDRTVLIVESLSASGDLASYLATFLDGFLLDREGQNADALLPNLSDLPVGWKLAFDEPVDITENFIAPPSQLPPTEVSRAPSAGITPTVAMDSTQVIIPLYDGTKTAVASATATQQIDYMSTIVALETTVSNQQATIVASQQQQIDANATSVALQEQVAGSSLNPVSVQESVQVDLNGVVAGNANAEDDARDELDDVMAKYVNGENCHIGFALISSRSSELGQGVQLSDAMATLIATEFPELMPISEGGGPGQLISESIALPGTTPVGEVQLQLFFNVGCQPAG